MVFVGDIYPFITGGHHLVWKPVSTKRRKACQSSKDHRLAYLVGGLEHGFYFPFHMWVVILPIDDHIFQDGYCTTNQIPLIHLHNGWDPVATSSMSLLTWEAGPCDVAEVRWTLPGRGNPSVVFCCFKGFDMVQLENVTVTQQNRIKLGVQP